MYARPLNLPEPPEIAACSDQIGADLLRVCALVSIQDIVNAESLWRTLEESSIAQNCFFQSYSWCMNWIIHHSSEQQLPLVLMLSRGNRAVAILPLMQVIVRGGVNVLRPLGEPHTQYAGLLTLDGSLDDDAANLLREALLSWPNIDTVFVQYVPASSPLQKIFHETSEIPTLRNEASQFDLRNFKDANSFAKSMPTRRRQAQRRATAALQSDGALQLQVIWPRDAAFEAALRQCLQWKQEWVTQSGRVNAGLNQTGHDAFLSSICNSSFNEGAVIFMLKAGERAVAYQLGFIYHGHYHLYTASFDWSLRRWSLGTVLIDMTIAWLVANNIQIFDLMGNPAPYKGNWNNQPLKLNAFITSRTWRGKLYGNIWIKLLRPSLKNVYHHMPQSIRVGLLRMLPSTD